MSTGQIIEGATSGEIRLYPLGDQEWKYPTYDCEVRLCEESEGGYSAYAPQLPGVASQGRDEDEALSNIREALSAAIRSYHAHDKEIPWVSAEDEPGPREIIRRIRVDA